MAATQMEQLVSLCKRRGFIFQNSDIYGGLQGVYDYGPLGVELKNNIKAAWWRAMVYERDDVEGLDAAILTNRKVLHYSGHEDTFSDPMVDCRKCKGRFRADHLTDGKCPNCGSTDLTEPRPFNLMFKTTVGPVVDEDNIAYLRPETAQAIFTQFKNVVDSTSRKLPFGIAQIGKSFRNEITPKNFIFRVREFEQAELEFFVKPGEDEKWHEYWKQARIDWWKEQGVTSDRFRVYDQQPDELAHYAKASRISNTASRGAMTSWKASPTAATMTSATTPNARTNSGWRRIATKTRNPRPNSASATKKTTSGLSRS